MKTPLERALIVIIGLIFALSLIVETITNLNGIKIPGLFTLSLAACASLFLVLELKSDEKRTTDIVLTVIAIGISLVSALYQIFS